MTTGDLTRLYDFQPGTAAKSAQVDAELDQLTTGHNTLNAQVYALTTDTMTINGVKTFASLPKVITDPTNDNELTRKSYVDYRSSILTKGADIASATTLTIPTAGGYFEVTGTTTINGFSASQQSRYIILRFQEALTLINSTTFILLGGADIKIEAGDQADFICEGSNTWRMWRFTRAASPPIRKIFKSTAQTITPNTVIEVPHTLGVVPDGLSARIKCIGIEEGYPVGRYVDVNTAADSSSVGGLGSAFSYDATKIYISYGSGPFTIRSALGNYNYGAGGTAGKWELYVNAWADI